MRRRRLRKSSGLSIVVLMSFVAVFVIGPLSMFVFELSRYNLASQELKNCVDASALTAACSQTSSNSVSTTITQTAAMDAAAYLFAQNTILNNTLSTTPAYTYGTSNPKWTPVANRAQLYFQFLDPTTNLPVAYGSTAGKILRVFGSWGYMPLVSKFTGIGPGPFLIQEMSDGGLPQLDVVLCFDISGSMDDFTNVSLVNRYTTGVLGMNGYSLAKQYAYTDSSGTAHTTSQGPLYWAVQCTNATGCSDNATWPMDISAVNYTNGPPQGTMYFNATGHGTHHGLPAVSLKTVCEAASSGHAFTDCVINIDGSQTQQYGATVNGFQFPAYVPGDANSKALGILVEASRGNLESIALATASGVPYLTWGITPQPGWWQAYYQAAMSAQLNFPTISSSSPVSVQPIRSPIGDAILAAQTFFTVLNNDCDVHFGLVTFSTAAGASATDTVDPVYTSPVPAIANYGTTVPSGGYPPDGVVCPNPTIFLQPTAGPAYSNFSSASPPPTTSANGALFSVNQTGSTPVITSIVAEGGTNIQDALDMALSMMLGSKSTDAKNTPNGRSALALARPGATRAIVLFTDGLPTSGGDSGTSDPKSQAEATAAAAAGIPIFTIGLCMTPTLQADQTTVLSDTSSTGIAKISGGRFAQTTSATALNAVFSNVARQLVQLVQ